ncbi:MAG: hypothetical protein LBS60_15370 [Deltaproteobacteria bacterium]|jgi:hypothetical protein|nr:hypothetical protein [Deltaproteobacteria bacterium]
MFVFGLALLVWVGGLLILALVLPTATPYALYITLIVIVPLALSFCVLGGDDQKKPKN